MELRRQKSAAGDGPQVHARLSRRFHTSHRRGPKAHPAADAHGLLQLASLTNQVALGPRAGKKVRRVQVLGGKEFAIPARCALYDWYNLHANVALSANDRAGLERLCRYVLRPPLAERAHGVVHAHPHRTGESDRAAGGGLITAVRGA
ncbi:MAG: hypothetical protein EXR71_21130 [Myxococcales bacterium]|nr:hypothetical protein [Myxococcales bacterium]